MLDSPTLLGGAVEMDLRDFSIEEPGYKFISFSKFDEYQPKIFVPAQPSKILYRN